MAAIDKSRHLASLFGEIATHGQLTRSELVRITGLSRATVARFIDELLDFGLIDSCLEGTVPLDTTSKETETPRGRPPTSLIVSRSLGQVIGVSFGLRRTVVLAKDLSGRELHHESESTPAWNSSAEAINWLAERITRARAHSLAPLRVVAVALPARIFGGSSIHQPPLSMSQLRGSGLHHGLTEALGVEVVLESDANMALEALTADGTLSKHGSVALLNMGTALTFARRRRDGSTVQGRSDAFGNLSIIPFQANGITTTLGAMLCTHGLTAHCRILAPDLDDLSQLWIPPETGYPPEVREMRAAFVEAVVTAMRTLTVSLEPNTIVLSGRLWPLVRTVISEIQEDFARGLSDPPRVLSIGLHGTAHSVAHGAAHLAVAHTIEKFQTSLVAGDDLSTG